MWYALTYSHDDCDGMTGLIFGETLQEVAAKLCDHCFLSLQEAVEEEHLSYEEIEEEYAADLDDYLRLLDSNDPDAADIEKFSFVFSDVSIAVISLASGYSELVDAFNAYAEDSLSLGEWRMLPGTDETPTTLREVDNELRALGSKPNPHFFKRQ